MTLLFGCGQGEASNTDTAAPPANPTAETVAPAIARENDIPIFPGSTPTEVPNLGAPGSDSRSGNTTAMETDATPEQVAAFYRQHFRTVGLPVRSDTVNAQGGLIAVGRDGGKGALLTISRIGARTRITVTRAR